MKPKILLAEDDTALSFVIKDNLTDAGFDVTTTTDGESA
jgi:DNA-binding response OmpR family regulator